MVVAFGDDRADSEFRDSLELEINRRARVCASLLNQFFDKVSFYDVPYHLYEIHDTCKKICLSGTASLIKLRAGATTYTLFAGLHR